MSKLDKASSFPAHILKVTYTSKLHVLNWPACCPICLLIQEFLTVLPHLTVDLFEKKNPHPKKNNNFGGIRKSWRRLEKSFAFVCLSVSVLLSVCLWNCMDERPKNRPVPLTKLQQWVFPVLNWRFWKRTEPKHELSLTLISSLSLSLSISLKTRGKETVSQLSCSSKWGLVHFSTWPQQDAAVREQNVCLLVWMSKQSCCSHSFSSSSRNSNLQWMNYHLVSGLINTGLFRKNWKRGRVKKTEREEIEIHLYDCSVTICRAMKALSVPQPSDSTPRTMEPVFVPPKEVWGEEEGAKEKGRSKWRGLRIVRTKHIRSHYCDQWIALQYQPAEAFV